MAEEAKWYVAHTYSGYENTVKATIEKAVENRNMGDLILAVNIPLTEAEIAALGVEKREVLVNYQVGDNVRITDGALESFLGTVEEIDMERQKVRVVVSMFGRETPVELDLDQIESI